MAWIRHCKNSHAARRNSWIQCDSNENCSYLCMLSLWIQGEKTLKFYTDPPKPMDHQTILNKKNTGGGMTITDFPIWVSQPHREHDTGSTLGSRIHGYKFHTTTATWFLKGCQKYTLEKNEHVQQAVLGNLDFNMQQNETRSYLSPYMKLSSKWSKDLKIRPDIMKVHEVKVEISLQVHVRTFWARLQCTGNKTQ